MCRELGLRIVDADYVSVLIVVQVGKDLQKNSIAILQAHIDLIEALSRLLPKEILVEVIQAPWLAKLDPVQGGVTSEEALTERGLEC